MRSSLGTWSGSRLPTAVWRRPRVRSSQCRSDSSGDRRGHHLGVQLRWGADPHDAPAGALGSARLRHTSSASPPPSLPHHRMRFPQAPYTWPRPLPCALDPIPDASSPHVGSRKDAWRRPPQSGRSHLCVSQQVCACCYVPREDVFHGCGPVHVAVACGSRSMFHYHVHKAISTFLIHVWILTHVLGISKSYSHSSRSIIPPEC
jgi:hypothetical protein